MAAIKSLRAALGALAGSPVLFLAGLAYGIVVLPQTALQLLGIPLVPFLLQVVTFFVTPFVVAGLIGMADEALAGDTSLSTLTAVGRERYLPLLLGNFVNLAIAIVFGVLALVVVLVAVFTVGIGAVAGQTAGGTAGGAALGGSVLLVLGLAAVLVLLVVVVNFFIQFYPIAIVAGDAGAVDGFRESVSLVRNNLLPALGYSLINLAVILLTAIPTVGFVLFRQLQQVEDLGSAGGAGAGAGAGAGGFPGAVGGAAQLFSPAEAALVAVVGLATTMLLTTFQRTYGTAFYRDHRADGRGGAPDATDPVGTTDPTTDDGGFEFGN
jgi:hypothetical protein